MKILIIGGVAGGATTATRLRRLDEKAEIVIFERGEYVSFANCGLPYYIGEAITDKSELILQTPKKFKSRFNIDVRINNEVVKINREKKEVEVRDVKTGETYVESYDKLVISTGAEPIVPNIEIEDRSKVFTLRNVPDTFKIKEYIDNNKIKSAAIIGGGYIGVEMAENLHNIGVAVNIIEMSNHLIGPLDYDMSQFVLNYVKQSGINVILENGVTSIKNSTNGVEITLNDGSIEAEMVILSIGVKPESRIAIDAGLTVNQRGSVIVNDQMKTSDNDIYALGDVVEITNFVTKQKDFIPLAGPANKQARVVANNIVGKDDKYLGTQGSSILKVLDMTIGMTGINETVAKRLNINYDKIFLTSGSHASYYPGATNMYIKVVFEKVSGKILGAQIVGYDGVDKRIDVLAVAIRAGMTAYELQDLELAYAPPFSSAKDPVNIIGNTIVNELEGDVNTIHIEQVDEFKNGKILLDVRTKREFAEGIIEGAINIPVDELRERISELDMSKEIIAYCHSGLRSYIASNILKGNGYKVYNMNGGYLLYSTVNNK